MGNRVFVSAVVVLWLSSMTWLVTERVLPSMAGGEPPAIEKFKTGETVAWNVSWSNRHVGQAASLRVPGADGTVEIHNRIALEDVPIAELAPTWMRIAVPSLGNMSLIVASRVEFDSLGNFSSFHSKVALNDMPSVLRISGRVDDSYLKLKVHSGQIPYEVSLYIPEEGALNEALFPGAELPYMYMGRSWQEEVYSPFRASGDPIEILSAKVVSEEQIQYEGESRRVFRVEYHSMFGSGISEKARLQAVSWVEPAGAILRRDMLVGESRLSFTRIPPGEADAVGDVFFESLAIGALDRKQD